MGKSMLVLPSSYGYVVEYETDKTSRRTGKKIWHEVLLTKDKGTAENRLKELKKQGLNTRMLETIF